MKKVIIISVLFFAVNAQAQIYSKVSGTIVAKQEVRQYDIAMIKERIESRNQFIETLQAENDADMLLIAEAQKVGVSFEKAIVNEKAIVDEKAIVAEEPIEEPIEK